MMISEMVILSRIKVTEYTIESQFYLRFVIPDFASFPVLSPGLK